MNQDMAERQLAALRIEVEGTVQGVGFRPFVWRLATGLRLSGQVRNVDGGVEIEACGPPAALEALVTGLRSQTPPLARIDSVTISQLPPPARRPDPGFQVATSHSTPSGGARPGNSRARLFPPDLATCDTCRRELFDPADRRHRYPFINCVDCGPRATIIDSLPYDRARTTMMDFPLCADCQAEYDNPADRRFHAEPVACPACGPTLAWRGPADRSTGPPALAAAVAALSRGEIVAVKGLGGYHLACDATATASVARLRQRKGRWAKPLAVMVADLAMAHSVAELGPAEAALLGSKARPIVVAPVRRGDGQCLAEPVTAGLREVGLFLPYTGVHHLLLADFGRPIVLTSGNRSDEPIAIDEEEALSRLAGIADGFLTHNRRIRSRFEDSVVTVIAGVPALLRRGRGYAPEPLDLPVPAPEPILAVGAHLKHTFTLVEGARAHLGGHTGDLADLATLTAYHRDLGHLRRLLELEPAWVAHDQHPGYLSTTEALGAFPPDRRVPVQHHHAHAAACLAEHGLTGPAIAVTLDGLGLGDDGTFWGGEVLLADLLGYQRLGRFGQAPMPGGEAAIRHPWRMALGYLLAAEGCGIGALAQRYLDTIDPAALRVIRQQLARGVNAPVASSAGRLFDTASALLGVCGTAAYDGHPAIALEQAAEPGEPGALPYDLATSGTLMVFDPGRTLAGLLSGLADGVPVPRLAARFQRTVALAVTDLAELAAQRTGVRTVCLSGGVFCNAWLLGEVPRLLAERGLTVLRPSRVPAGDGGISYGQAAVAAARLAAGCPRGRPPVSPADQKGTTSCA